jgi:predicted regulator of Ras-like GTPase activity (Roadblock/LC7/MglB family)
MTKLDDLLQEVRTQLGSDLITTDVVGMDGMSIAGVSNVPNFDASAATARLAMMMKLASNVSGKTNQGKVDDTLTTTEKAYILTRFLGDGAYYWDVIVTKDAVLGMVRMVMNEYADPIWKAIPR